MPQAQHSPESEFTEPPSYASTNPAAPNGPPPLAPVRGTHSTTASQPSGSRETSSPPPTYRATNPSTAPSAEETSFTNPYSRNVREVSNLSGAQSLSSSVGSRSHLLPAYEPAEPMPSSEPSPRHHPRAQTRTADSSSFRDVDLTF